MATCSDRIPGLETNCNPDYDAPKVEPPYDTAQITVWHEPNDKPHPLLEGAQSDLCFKLPALWLLSLAEKLPEFKSDPLRLEFLNRWAENASRMIQPLAATYEFGDEIAKHLPPFGYTHHRNKVRYDRFEFLRVDKRGWYTFKLLQSNGE